jgi:AraC family L-rhamnose operon regulatory protein RhaS
MDSTVTVNSLALLTPKSCQLARAEEDMQLVTIDREHRYRISLWHNADETFAPELATDTHFRLVLVERGAGVLRIKERRDPFIAPTLFCLNEKERPVLEQSLEFQARALYFHPRLVNGIFTFENVRSGAKDFTPADKRDLAWLRPFIRRNAGHSGHIALGPVSFQRISSLFSAVNEQLVQQPDQFWSCRSVSFLLELFLLLERISYTPEAAEQSIPSESLRDTPQDTDSIILYLHTHYQEKITVRQLTTRFHTNRTTLAEQFREATGMPLTAYLIRLRLRLAASMLQDTGLLISEIRERVGFKDASHFGRTFRKYLGHSPSEYRRLYSRPGQPR